MSRVMGTEGIRPRQRGIREEAALWPVQQGLQFNALRDGGDEKKKKKASTAPGRVPSPALNTPKWANRRLPWFCLLTWSGCLYNPAQQAFSGLLDLAESWPSQPEATSIIQRLVDISR